MFWKIYKWDSVQVNYLDFYQARILEGIDILLE